MASNTRKGSIVNKPLTYLPPKPPGPPAGSVAARRASNQPPPTPSFSTAEAPEKAAEAVNIARVSSRKSLLGGLNPEKATEFRDMRDASTALALSYWLSEETKCKVRGEPPEAFLEDLHSGVVLCTLANKYAPFKFKNPPTNEFQRMENFDLFAKSLKPLKLRSLPPSAKQVELKALLPCLLELATRARGKDSGKDEAVDVSNFFCVLCKGSTSFDSAGALMAHLESNHANLNFEEM